MEVLKIKDLCNNFEKTKVLDNINIEVNKGEFVSIVGPSGCGKSTLFRIITNLLKDNYSGNCLIEGIEAVKYNRPIAYMPQKDLLLPWRTLFANASIPLEIRGIKNCKKYINPLLNDFGLAGFENSYPHELSGGMRQRGALLRTFLINSELMLLDEPFGALDAITRLKMQELLIKVWQKYQHTVLFITHDIEEAIFLSDKIYIMSSRPGRIIKEIDIDFLQPRTEEDLLTTKFLEYKKEILKYLRNYI